MTFEFRRIAFGLAAIFLFLATEAWAQAGDRAPNTQPEQGWAHRDGRETLRAIDDADVIEDVQSRLMISEAFARWGIAFDDARLDVVESLFTDDALFEVALGSGDALVSVRGKEAIVANVASALAQQNDQRRHLISNVVIDELSVDEASALAYGIVTIAADGLSLGASVLYAADLVRCPDGHWRFSSFFIGMDSYQGVPPRQLVGSPSQ